MFFIIVKRSITQLENNYVRFTSGKPFNKHNIGHVVGKKKRAIEIVLCVLYYNTVFMNVIYVYRTAFDIFLCYNFPKIYTNI